MTKMNSNDITRNRTRNLQAFSEVLQPTGSKSDPTLLSIFMKF